MTDNWALCVPTYNRAKPEILQMLKYDDKLVLHLFVRKNCYDSGMYDALKDNRQIDIVVIEDESIHELGETRNYIMNWCKSNNVEFCAMFDDGVWNVVNEIFVKEGDIHAVISNIVSNMMTDKLSDKMIGWSFKKRFYKYSSGRVSVLENSATHSNYFVAYPGQAVVLNVDKAFEYGLTYKSLDDVGFEDAAFFADALKAGLVYGGSDYVKIDAVVPNEKKIGGSHSSSENLCKKYDDQSRKLQRYIGDMMGVQYQKRYRSYANGLLGLFIWDFDFFREVLCSHRDENKEIIEQQFIKNL